MGSSEKLLEAIMNAAKKQNETNIYCDIGFGTVTNAEPLEVQVEQKLKITQKFLCVAQHLTNYEIDCEFVTNEVEGFFAKHNGDQNVFVSPKGKQTGKVLLKNALKKGDKVVVGRFNGGQQYIVIDRI